MKTPEDLAAIYISNLAIYEREHSLARSCFLAGYQAAELKAKIEFAAKYDHKSPLQVIAAEYVKRRGTTGPLALLEENRFIDGYEAGLHASQPQWISVKDRLPEDLGVVMITFDTVVSVGRYSGEWHCLVFPELPIESVTHWMPLPKPPKE